jgi:hypothetical protein
LKPPKFMLRCPGRPPAVSDGGPTVSSLLSVPTSDQ